MVDVRAESMVGGTIFHRTVIQREISRVLVLNLSGKKKGAQNTDGRSLSLTAPSLLSMGSYVKNDLVPHHRGVCSWFGLTIHFCWNAGSDSAPGRAFHSIE
jgi:hypothetical protein